VDVFEALNSRISCRAFLPDPVPRATVEKLLEQAQQAPSGGNLQPWHIFALTGTALEDLVGEVHETMKDQPRGETPAYRIYPQGLKQPYFDRRDKCGEDLYAAINVTREDKQGRLQQFRRNFELFGAPVGLFLYLDKTMGPPQWADAGMFLQSFMLAARQEGLHTCAQESWSRWPQTVAKHVQPPADLMLFCGIALGHMDVLAPVNKLRTERAGVKNFASFKGFSD